MAEVGLEFRRIGEEWVLLRFGDAICDEVSERVRLVYENVKRLEAVCECIPTYTDLALRVRGDALEWEGQEWRALVSTFTDGGVAQASRRIEVPVRFAQAEDPACDWQHYAQQVNLPVDTIIDKLLATEFTVAMIGFLPGMPYLSGLPAELHLPRRESLATAAPGTFAIGGQQAGFLPNQTLTGWWRLGLTAQAIFDLNREPSSLFRLGDKVQLLRMD